VNKKKATAKQTKPPQQPNPNQQKLTNL